MAFLFFKRPTILSVVVVIVTCHTHEIKSLTNLLTYLLA